MCISRSTAFMLNFNCCLILLPVCKSLLSWVRMRIQKVCTSCKATLLSHRHCAYCCFAKCLPLIGYSTMFFILVILVLGMELFVSVLIE